MTQEQLKELNLSISQYRQKFSFRNWSLQQKEDIKNNFTYHSNKLEGLEFTYGETIEFLKSGTIRKKNPRLKDIYDLENHKTLLDQIFSNYEAFALSEQSILDLHAELMKSPYQWLVTDALEGGAGEYKTSVNGTYRSNGSFHEYMPPEKVKDGLRSLIEETNTALNINLETDPEKHPLKIIADFHYRFLNELHPFTDGNGRIARILTNLLLLQHNLPIVVIHENDKEDYHLAFMEAENDPEKSAMTSFFIKKLKESVAERI